MGKFSIFAGYSDIQAGLSYEWAKTIANTEPIMDIVGGGATWTKVTHGPVVIRGNENRTTVRVTGVNAWKIVGGETIE